MTKEEFINTGLSMSTALVVIRLKNDPKPIFPARLRNPSIYERKPQKKYLESKAGFPDIYTAGVPLSLSFDVYVEEVIDSPTIRTPAHWSPRSVPLADVELVERMPT